MNIQYITRKIGVDRAVFFGILAKIWGIFGGSITTLVIANKFTPDIQGYYYTFASILGLQGFADLGIASAISPFASHEWSRLAFNKVGQIVGDKNSLSRLVSLGQLSLRWFRVVSIFGVILLIVGGYFFFSTSSTTIINWKMPWILLSLLTGINFCLVPLWALLEGCNQVNKVYYYRLFQGLFSSVSIWVAILLGAKLFTTVISTLIVIVWSLYFFCKEYKIFFKTIYCSKPSGLRIDWLTEILPLQWRFALSGIAGYLSFSLFTPILFRYHGAIVAGQMGMTWVLVYIMAMLSICWLSPKAPHFGILIAQKKFQELDHLFWRLTKIIFTITLLAILFAWGAVYFLNKINHPLAKRMLPPLPTGLFLIAQLFLVFSMPFSTYLRAHKREPIFYLSISMALLITLSNLILGKYYSAAGMAIGYLILNMLSVFFIVLIWKRCRVRWHNDIIPTVIK